MNITTNIEGLLPLKQQMQLLAMPKPLRRRLLNKTAKFVIRDSRKRVRNQVDLKGMPFAERARKRKGNRKMMANLAKQLRVTGLSSTDATIGFYRPSSGRIAAKQQYGAIEHITAAKLQANDKGGQDKPATRRQAIALRDAGFKIKGGNGKRLKSPSLKWVQQNMKVGQAGAALRWLRDKANETVKTSWTTVLPARSFLGANASEVTQYTGDIMKQMTKEIAHGAR
tara:strand:+ start:87891 stop:88568 length:678 start_codon:yes stop_codon:yes gene_type:complete